VKAEHLRNWLAKHKLRIECRQWDGAEYGEKYWLRDNNFKGRRYVTEVLQENGDSLYAVTPSCDDYDLGVCLVHSKTQPSEVEIDAGLIALLGDGSFSHLSRTMPDIERCVRPKGSILIPKFLPAVPRTWPVEMEF